VLAKRRIPSNCYIGILLLEERKLCHYQPIQRKKKQMAQNRAREIERALADDLLTPKAKELLQVAMKVKNESLIARLLSPNIFFNLEEFQAELVSNFTQERSKI
jgi:hypothetical protein